MKNKNVKLGALVLAAVTLFTATAFASASAFGQGGYEAFKQIMKTSEETRNFSSVSLNGKFKMSDNGKIISEMTGEVKGNVKEKEASGNIQLNLMGKEQELSFYKNGETAYLVDETNKKNYKLVNMTKDINKNYKACRRDNDAGAQKMGKTGEALMDYFMGDLKSQFELTKNADGTRSITLDLNENEIPAPLNLLIGIAAENSDHSNINDEDGMDKAKKELLMQKLPFLKEFDGLEKEMPKLKQDVKLAGVFLKLNVDDNNQIKSFDVKMSITGKDTNGENHEISLMGSSNITGLNSTSVDTFNADGKSFETIDVQEFSKK